VPTTQLSTVEMTLIGCPLLSVLANSSAIFGLLSLVLAPNTRVGSWLMQAPGLCAVVLQSGTLS